MQSQELLEELRSILRLRIASRLKIEKEVYDSSLQAQSAVNRCLTNVMSLGNNPDLEVAVQEICDYRHFGQNLNPAELSAVRGELVASHNTFPDEIRAYAVTIKMIRDGHSRTDILKLLRNLIKIDHEYSPSN